MPPRNVASGRDPYQVLGVARDAGDAEIRRAYRRLARQFHPDRNQGDPAAEARFKEVQEAYERVGTAEAREAERRQSFAGFGGFPGGGGMGGFPGGMGGFDDLLGQMFGGRAPPRQAQGFGPRGGARPQAARGDDVRVHLDLTLEQAEAGGSFPFTVRRLRLAANGAVESKAASLRMTLESGRAHGSSTRLKGQGHEHPSGGTGDAIVVLRIDPGAERRWEEGRLVQSVAVPYSVLMLGGKVDVTLPDGKAGRLTVPAGSMVGDRRRMTGRGYAGGDLDLEFELPDVGALSEAQRAALSALNDAGL